jgi:SagB-type dehydrogenase family enzyme
MRVKAPRTLVMFPRDHEIVVYNYLTRDAITCAPADVYWLTVAPEWTPVEELLDRHPHIEPQSLRQEIIRLAEAGILLQEDSASARTEAIYQQSWELGIAAGVFHFSLLDNDYGDHSESVKKQQQRALGDPSPDLFWKNAAGSTPLPAQPRPAANHLFEVMRRRRTIRNVRPEALTLEDLGECLFAGLGVTDFVQAETGLLPLKMTPSGGARNPFEAFVWARDVDGLTPGLYHYSALQHSLEKIAPSPAASPMELVKGQEWANAMPAIIFLVAVLNRTTWKYNDPNAYRVVLIEAGHIAQNIMLACASSNLTACPTAALAHSQVSEMLALKDIVETPIYALLIAKPAENPDFLLPAGKPAQPALQQALAKRT